MTFGVAKITVTGDFSRNICPYKWNTGQWIWKHFIVACIFRINVLNLDLTMPKSDTLRRNVKMLNPANIILSSGHQTWILLYCPFRTLSWRQLKGRRIYYFIVAFWHVQVVTHFIYNNCRVLMVHIRSNEESLEGFKIVVFRIFFQFGKNLFQWPFFFMDNLGIFRRMP